MAVPVAVPVAVPAEGFSGHTAAPAHVEPDYGDTSKHIDDVVREQSRCLILWRSRRRVADWLANVSVRLGA